jgi:lipopolysaccharide/colanic/teichoic acid biosynthesis glycosyltransferase
MRPRRSLEPVASVLCSSGDFEDPWRSPVAPQGSAARLLDIVVSAAALIFLAPLMILIAAAILIESGRPILFSQLRVGHRGRHFRMYKFRKFHEGGVAAGPPLTMEDDPRLTAIGRILARTKLDELPQLWNVLKGDMSIVGPRPESLDFRDCFKGPFQSVLQYKPGIFGPSQVLFRNEPSLYRECSSPEQFYRDILFPLKAHIDLSYFVNRTLLRDIAWAVRGGFAVFGWSSLVHHGQVLVEEAEDWVREAGATGDDLASHIGLLIRRRGVLEMIRESGTEIAAARSAGLLPDGGPYAADRAYASECRYLQAPDGRGRRNEPIVGSRCTGRDPSRWR